jgi:hypothetical protein
MTAPTWWPRSITPPIRSAAGSCTAPGPDEPRVWYESSDGGERRWLYADQRGSIVAVADPYGNATAINRYDEYGKPQGPAGPGTLTGRFGYTGQAWLSEVQLKHYKARMYPSDWPRQQRRHLLR